MKSLVRRVLEKIVNPHRFNDSLCYSAYCRLRYPNHWNALQAEMKFVKSLLADVGNDLVFDIGANAGHKALQFDRVAKKVICLEPDPTAVEALQARFASRPSIIILAEGVGDTVGSLELIRLEKGSAYNTFSNKWAEYRSQKSAQEKSGTVVVVPITTLDKLIEVHGVPNYIKIDVEGFEIQVLRGLSHAVPLVSFECNLPIFEQESIDCLGELERLHENSCYNWIADDGHSFASQQWVSAGEMERVIKANQTGYMEIYCRLRPIGFEN
jgi:FkbM family methyltransferase